MIGFAIWDERSSEQWLQDAGRFAKMAERFYRHPQLKARFSALARDGIVRAKDGRSAEARVVCGTDWRGAQPASLGAHPANANLDYFRCREAQERAAASQSSDLRVRRVHLEMALRYGALISRPEANGARRQRCVP